MSDPEIEPLAPELRALLASERTVGPAPGAGKSNVKARLDASLFGPGGRGGGGDGGAGSPEGKGGRAPSTRRGPLRDVAVYAAGALTGGLLVYASVASRTPSVPSGESAVSVVSRPSELPTVFAPRATRAPEAPAESASLDAGAAPTTTATVVPPAGDSLPRERALLDPARTALGRGDATSALEAVRRHEAQFAEGKLAEEREAIAVQALVLLHRGAEARARGLRFKQRYAGSVLAPAVDAALAAAE